MNEQAHNNTRIAKNTIYLYFRTILIMMVSLYTTRIVLKVLGVEDFGIYNAVGGVVVMFSSITGALSASISRFITYELGKGDSERLNTVFVSSKCVLLIISIIILVLGIIIGSWFLNSYMIIPDKRLTAANYVLICSIFSFCVNLLSVPYNACIIAHEHMKAYAYIGLLDAFLRLLSVYVLELFLYDRLVLYAILTLFTALMVRLLYWVYCRHNFMECRNKGKFKKEIVKNLLGFSSWSFITNSCWIFNTQGINLLMNTFFGVTLNAARGIASQVENGLLQIADNFNSAMSPQIIKYYAKEQKNEMFNLICRGSKFSFYLLLVFSIPVMIETELLLNVWLDSYPNYTILFIRLSLIGSMIDKTGMTLYTGCIATGNIKTYVIPVALIGFSVFPITWLFYEFGAPVYATYIVFICVYLFVNLARLLVMKRLLRFSIFEYVKRVYLKIIPTTLLCICFPCFIYIFMEPSWIRFTFLVVLGSIYSIMCIYYSGLSMEEKNYIKGKISIIYKRVLS